MRFPLALTLTLVLAVPALSAEQAVSSTRVTSDAALLGTSSAGRPAPVGFDGLDFGGAEGPPAGCPCVGGTPENEPDCGLPTDSTNGGCNYLPNVFSPLSCGETICGTAGAADNFRDTDWYELILAAPSAVELTITSEFGAYAGIINSSGGPPSCDNLGADWLFYTLACVEGGDSRELSAGTWWIFAAFEAFDGLACGAPYTLTVTCPIFSDDFELDDVCAWSNGAGTSDVCSAWCGNGAVNPGESCDDGNLAPGDGCNEYCQDSCYGFCDSEDPVGNCYCDIDCLFFEDCCHDACAACGYCF